MTAELVTVEQGRYLPALTHTQAIERRNALVAFVQDIMVENVDYGAIPGTTKPTLLKPGAEKLCSFFGLTPDFECLKEIEQWGDDGTEPLFYYKYKCRLLRDGRIVGDGEGSANSRESKYRYRSADRVCPTCSKPTIIKGKAEYGGGWLCFTKKGGCGAKFSEGDPQIEGQPTGRIPNPDIADIVNTLQKMAQKRSLIASTLIAVNASEFFTQDVEDMQPIADERGAANRERYIAGIYRMWMDEQRVYGREQPDDEQQLELPRLSTQQLVALGTQVRARLEALKAQNADEPADELL